MKYIFQVELGDNIKQLAMYIAGYVTKKVKKHLKCDENTASPWTYRTTYYI